MLGGMSDEQQPRSAREKLIRFAEENHNGLDPWCDPETGYFVDDWQAHLGNLLDAYAHGLAEQQRAYAREVGVPLEDGDIVSAGDVIDLIDPQASAHSASSPS